MLYSLAPAPDRSGRSKENDMTRLWLIALTLLALAFGNHASAQDYPCLLYTSDAADE